LGSTVIALFPRGTMRFEGRLARGERVLMGALIGRTLPTP
jgi:phosphatidylserine decarboxylase